MNILGIFLNNELRTGGHKRYLELMEGLAKRGHRVTVFMNTELDWEPAHFSARRVTVRYAKGSHPFNGRRFLSAIRKVRAESRHAVLADTDWIVIFGETHWPAAKHLSSLFGAPVLFAFRSDTVTENRLYLRHESLSPFSRLKLRAQIARETVRERDIAKKARAIAFQSYADLAQFDARHPGAREKSVVVRGDIRQPRFKSEYASSNASSRCEKLLFVGTLGVRKGLRYLLEALPAIRDAGCRNISLDILAAGKDFSPFAKIIAENGLEDSVRFHGKVADPLPWMKDADLMVAPSIFDSYPNTVLEALHTGLPVIGSNSGGIPDMLSDGSLLFEPASSDGIARKVIELNLHEDKYLAARKLCSARRGYFDFDWAGEWEKVLNRE